MKAPAICFAVLALGCSSESLPDEPDEPGEVDSPTYYQDVAPILYTNCVGCHQEGGIGPFELDTPDAAVSTASVIAYSVSERLMPPWPPGELSKPMLHERKLSDAEIDTLVAWSEAGAPLGDPDNPGPLAEPEVVDIGTVDMTFDIGVDYVPDVSLDDDYRCFLVDLDVAQAQAVTGFRVLPGNAKTVHHVIASSFSGDSRAALEALDAETPDRAGWPCFSGLVDSDVDARQTGSLGSWVPGVSAVEYPNGTARYLFKDNVAVVQVHYNLAGGSDPDRTAIELAFESPTAGLTPLGGLGLSNRTIEIPAGEERVEFNRTMTAAEWIAERGGQAPADGDGYVMGAGMHAHLLATEMQIAINGEPVLDIPKWDFHWQGSYQFQEPIRVGMDDTITLRCVYDNTNAHRAAQGLGNAVPVIFGDGTEDEMCLGSFSFVDELP